MSELIVARSSYVLEIALGGLVLVHEQVVAADSVPRGRFLWIYIHLSAPNKQSFC